jgi:MFS family permease
MTQIPSSSSPDIDKSQSSHNVGFSRFSTALRAMRHRNYRLFFAGQLISLIGTWMQMVAQSWLVYRLTGSSFLLGSVGFASQIPVFLLAFIGGIVADRYNRHRIVIGTQTSAMLLAFILSGLTLSGTVQIWHIFVLSTLLGIVNAFDMPARQAFIVELVGKDDLMNAIALNSSLFNGARVLGPAFAGMLIAGLGEGWCFFSNAVSYIAVIIGLLLMKLKSRPSAARGSSAISNVLEGLLYVRRTRSVRALLMLVALISIAGMPYSILMPIFAEEILSGGARGLGILMGFSGLGAFMGAIYLAAQSETRGLGRMIAFSCAGMGTSLILFSISRLFWVSALFLIPVGFTLMVQMASANTLIQTIVPDHLRGRVMSVHVMMFMGMMPFGSLVAGSVAEKLGAPLTVGIGAIGCLLGSIVFTMRLSSLQLINRRSLQAHADDRDLHESANLVDNPEEYGGMSG